MKKLSQKTTAMVVAAGMAAEEKAAVGIAVSPANAGSGVSADFVVDDGFRLESVPTLEWCEKRLPEAYEMHRRGGQMHLIGAFLCGWLQLVAQGFVGKARRGVHGKGDGGTFAPAVSKGARLHGCRRGRAAGVSR